MPPVEPNKMDQQKGALILSSGYSLMKSIFYMNYKEWGYCAVHLLFKEVLYI